MYVPPAFQEEDIATVHAAIRAARLATLITATEEGMIGTPLPMILDATEGPHGTLYGHVARANPQWKLAPSGDAMAIFVGPDAYVTPSWYATKRETGKVVPTWNYATVHAWGKPRVMNDDSWLRRQIEDLTASRENLRGAPWQVDDAPADFIAMQMRAIVGVEIPIARIEGKWKMSQNRPEADRTGVIAGFREAGEAGEAIAAIVEERGAKLK
jgi:transcriptional regulator